MFAGLFEPDVLIVVVIIAVVFFGGSQIPKLARGLGQAQKEFKKGLAEGADDDKSTTEKAAIEKSTTDKPSDS